MPIFLFWLQQVLMNPKVWNLKWKMMTIKAVTSRTMRHQFVSHRLPLNFLMRMSALNQNVSFYFYLQFNNTMSSDTFFYLSCLYNPLDFWKWACCYGVLICITVVLNFSNLRIYFTLWYTLQLSRKTERNCNQTSDVFSYRHYIGKNIFGHLEDWYLG